MVTKHILINSSLYKLDYSPEGEVLEGQGSADFDKLSTAVAPSWDRFQVHVLLLELRPGLGSYRVGEQGNPVVDAIRGLRLQIDSSFCFLLFGEGV